MDRQAPEAWSLRGRVALVTGASGSLGAEVSRVFASRGASVAVHGRQEARLARLVEEISAAGGTARAFVGDVTDASHLAGTARAVEAELGSIDTLVTLAGGDGSPERSADLAPDRWREVIETDLTSTFLTIHAALPQLLKAGDSSIVTVASTAGRRASRANAAYAAAKAGVVMLTEHLAKEYAAAGVRVNCVAPSVVETDTLRSRMPADQLDALAAHVPLGRLGQSADVAQAIAYLSAGASSWITGTTLDITGGMTL
ncbi:SDR family oxidoreductase [Nocardioides marmoriginsengisoli]|uniref:SDR family oxidoreductase n=1 Tax=Nocardioides marmoriginsengisoli TaxID=661483 RepID=A0A3N0CI06_9ACTN|nr:SDR family NAD(P)-dependent oxidoreductase [Nocardioides marmoriginsengisoli]RNL62593.1 SDR family oxidoreductase [Nocardioides marmoriginsengisoli]